MKLRTDGPLALDGVYVQKGGGYVEFTLAIRSDIDRPNEMKDWKYSIIYRDAMRTEKLDDPTTCRVFGWTRKQDSRQINQVKRTATALELERDPYGETILSLVDAPVDEVIESIVKEFVSYYDDYERIVEAVLGDA
jgi:hypothetical protein